ncbi:hypothetical protein [Yinghuangia soli]|uniref:Uncharacterized protein n=1 Tax=Yinghuangia soli TaxID=2908204 RepID=A0AA41TWB8_9ACTN|nr:hypothetical protein [Yinghuangia soli]MCF2525673.1 hypothetical protein [Yinghuangia soli]
MILLVSLVFGALAAITLVAASTGYRGIACDPDRGYVFPEHVVRDPELNRRANQSVAFWCTGVSVLAVAPLFPLVQLMTDGVEGQSLTTSSATVLAAYGLGLVAMGRVPFELIKRYAAAPTGTPAGD